MAYLTLSYLRERCDKFQDRTVSPNPSWVSEFEFNLDEMERVSNFAKLALNTYNQQEVGFNIINSFHYLIGIIISFCFFMDWLQQNNFDLDKVCKLNCIGAFYCMTFRATDAETSECRLFRGVVKCLTRAVFLCEIKEPDDIAVPSDCVENYVEAISESKDDHSPCTRNKRARIEKDLGNDSAVGFVDVNYGSFDVSGGVNVGLMAGSDVA